VPEPQVTEPQVTEPQVTEAKPVEEPATAQPQSVAVAKEEAAPEQKIEPPKTEDAKEPAREPEPAVAMIEAPTPAPPRDAKPVESAPAEVAPKPAKNAAPAREQRRIAAPTREKPTRQTKVVTAAAPANNIGVGRSSDDANYRGRVAAHLSRYKHPLGDTRGTAAVTFTVSGSGAVTSVRLAHGSGVAGIDSEVQAMVRRASPFPAPPGGRPQSFTVPVSFKVN